MSILVTVSEVQAVVVMEENEVVIQTIADTRPIIAGTNVPLTSLDPGTPGTIAWDNTYIYVCVAPNTWRIAELFTW